MSAGRHEGNSDKADRRRQASEAARRAGEDDGLFFGTSPTEKKGLRETKDKRKLGVDDLDLDALDREKFDAPEKVGESVRLIDIAMDPGAAPARPGPGRPGPGGRTRPARRPARPARRPGPARPGAGRPPGGGPPRPIRPQPKPQRPGPPRARPQGAPGGGAARGRPPARRPARPGPRRRPGPPRAR